MILSEVGVIEMSKEGQTATADTGQCLIRMAAGSVLVIAVCMLNVSISCKLRVPINF